MSTINDEHRHWFVHVPKCAGSSMERLRFVGGSGHAPARQLSAAAPASYFGWAFVRHPGDRLVAIYHAAQQHAPNRYFPGTLSFADWIAGLPKTGAKLVHARPMVDFLCDHQGRIAVEFVGRFERLEADWATVCDRIGVRTPPLPHRVASRHGPWPSYYTPALFGHVVRCYRQDFRTFGYQEELP